MGVPTLSVQALQGRSIPEGRERRTKALIKAGLATAAIVKLLSNASKNAARRPTLCKYVPNINNIKSSLSTLAGKVKDGTASPNEIDGTSNLFGQLKNATGFTRRPAHRCRD